MYSRGRNQTQHRRAPIRPRPCSRFARRALDGRPFPFAYLLLGECPKNRLDLLNVLAPLGGRSRISNRGDCCLRGLLDLPEGFFWSMTRKAFRQISEVASSRLADPSISESLAGFLIRPRILRNP